MAEVASAFVSLMPSARGFGAKLNSQVGPEVDKAGKSSGSRFGKAFGAVAALGAGAAIVGLVKGSVGLEAAFSKTMNVLQATTGESAAGMKRLSDLALKMGADTTFSANDASGAMLELARGGIKSAEIEAGALEGTLTLAAAGELDMATAANIAVKSMGQFNLKGKDMAKVASALAGGANASSASVGDMATALAQGGLAANSVGFSIEETTGILAAFSNAGLEGSDAGTSMKTMLDRLQPVTKTAKDAMIQLGGYTKETGSTFVKANGEFKSAAEIAGILAKGTADLSEAERKRLITQAFGSDAQRAATILAKEGAKGIGKMVKATSDQNAAQRTAKATMKGTAGAIEAFKGSVETATLKLGLFFAPAIQTGLGLLTEWVNGIPDAFATVRDAAETFYDKISNNATAVAAFESVRDTIVSLKDGLGDAVDNAKKIGGALGNIDLAKLDAGDLGKKLGEAIATALEGLISLSGKLASTLGAMFAKVDWVSLGIAMGKQVPALLVGLAAGILAFDLGSLLGGLADNWGTVLIGVITIAFAPARLVGTLAKILTKIPFVGPFIARGLTWFNEIGGAFSKRVTGFVGDLGRSFTRGFGSLKIPGGGLVKNVMRAFKAIPGRVSDFFGLLKTRIGVWALDAFEAMGKGARTAVGGALRFVGGIPGMILRALGSLARTLSPRGFELIAGLLQAAKARFVSVATYIGAIPGRLLGALGDLGSLFYNKGVELIAGLARGISAKMTDAINAVKAGLDRIKGMLPGSPIKWGPLKNWNQGGAGKRLMDLVAKGITDATPKTIKAAKSAFEKIADSLEAQRDRLRGTLDGLKGDFASLADSVSSAFTGDLFGVSAIEADAEAGIAGKTVGQSFVDNLLSKKGELTGLLASFNTLKGWGIDPAFLSQLFASGNGALITELAGMGQAGATGAANLFGEVTNLGNQLGTAVAQNDPVAKRIDETNRLLTQVNKQLSYLGSDIGKELNASAAKAQRDRKGKGKK